MKGLICLAACLLCEAASVYADNETEFPITVVKQSRTSGPMLLFYLAEADPEDFRDRGTLYESLRAGVETGELLLWFTAGTDEHDYWTWLVRYTPAGKGAWSVCRYVLYESGQHLDPGNETRERRWTQSRPLDEETLEAQVLRIWQSRSAGHE